MVSMGLLKRKMEYLMAQSAKIGPAAWFAPAPAPVYKRALLPLITLLPLCGLWMQEQLTQTNAAWTCAAALLVYTVLPLTTLLRRDNDLRAYRGYRKIIVAQLREPSTSSEHRRYLLRSLSRLRTQYHLALNPAPAMRVARTLRAAVFQLARMIWRF